VLHAIAWYLKNDPRTVCGYATYGADLSYSKSRVARSLARTAGVDLAHDAQGVKEWRTRQGGGLLATGVGGPFTGFGVNHLFVDDPFKNRADAESATKRQTLIDWWNDVASTRLEPGGSAIVFATRWHPEDLSGYLIEKGWRYIRLPAIDDAGAALWPERYGVGDFASHRTNEYTWASLFQGLPRPRGGSVFNTSPATYTPEALAEILKKPSGWRKGIGVDLAYSRRTNADHSAAIVGLSVRIEGKPYLYIIELERAQLEARMFAARGAALQKKHGACPALWYAAGAEKGVADLLTGYGFKVGTKPATHDKFTRAQAYAAAWNDGRVLLPANVGPDSWVNVFLAEHLSFTGSDDKEDDQVDAGAALYDLIAGSAPVVRGVGTQPIGFF
jgi:phage terminase large subunit-like protein